MQILEKDICLTMAFEKNVLTILTYVDTFKVKVY